jgi:diacylglycerol kinase (ATP)
MKRIGVITNTRSRQNRKDPGLADTLARILGPSDCLKVTQTIDDLHLAIDHFQEMGITWLGINGGDGTNHRTLTALVERWEGELPQIVLLRGGTMNTVSNGFGGTGNPRSILAALVARRDRDARFETICRRLLRIDDGNVVHYGFMFGTGTVYNFLEEYYSHGDVTPVTAARTLTHGIASTLVQGPLFRRLTAQVPATVEVNHERWRDGDFIGVLAATQPQIGLGFRPFYRADEDPNHFAAIAIQGSLLNVVRALPAIRLGREPRVPGYSTTTGQSLRLNAFGEQRYMIDGELYQCAAPIEVTCGPMLQIVSL